MVAFTIVAGIAWFLHPLSANAQEVTTVAGGSFSGFLDGTGTAARIALVDYGIRTIIDLRQTNETRAEPNFFAHSAEVAYHHLNMIGDEPLGIEPAPGEADRPQQIAHGYCGYLDKRQAQVNRILATLARAENQAALYHCAADMAERYNNPARQPMPIL